MSFEPLDLSRLHLSRSPRCMEPESSFCYLRYCLSLFASIRRRPRTFASLDDEESVLVDR